MSDPRQWFIVENRYDRFCQPIIVSEYGFSKIDDDEIQIPVIEKSAYDHLQARCERYEKALCKIIHAQAISLQALQTALNEAQAALEGK